MANPSPYPQAAPPAARSGSRASNKEILGWAMFDFANQAYTLLIITVVFGDLFTRVIVADADSGYRLGNLLWSLSLAASYLLVVLTAPFLGALMDLNARHKQFLFFSYIATIITTALLYFVAPGYILLGMLLIVFSNYAYSIGESFIASFLPHLGPPRELGRISGFGWALGYVGGLVATALALLFLGEVRAENFDNLRWVGPFAAAFFLLAAIPTFVWLKEPGQPAEARGRLIWREGLNRVGGSLAHLSHFRDLNRFLLSALFAMSGIYIIIAFTFIYGAQVIAWDEPMRVLTFISVQLTAATGALLFGWAQDRIGSRFTYQLNLLLWIGSILMIWLTPQLADWLNGLGYDLHPQDVFWLVAMAAGLCLGSTQSASRAIVGQLTPLSRTAEFFGFWGLSHKLAAIIGLIGVGLMQVWVGLENAILLCAVFFALAFVVSLSVDVARGEASAAAYRE